MRFYNADGTAAEMCGNGARCIARYAFENGLAGEAMVIETVAGPVRAWRLDRRTYRVRLNDPGAVVLNRPIEADGVESLSYLELGDPGVPHAVVRCPGLADRPEDILRALGQRLRHHSAFPKGANVNFYEVTGDNRAALKTYERGVEDSTRACGPGAGATAAALVLLGEVSGPRVRLTVPGGDLWVEVEREADRVTGLYLIGDTNLVCKGEITDEDLDLLMGTVGLNIPT